MIDLITKKRDGGVLAFGEMKEMIDAYVSGEIPDYQMSAMLMAIYLKGMTDAELTDFTKVMVQSGEVVDLSAIPGIKVDKHSTGGVGDKTTLILAPMAAACGVKVAKMSGRGLGFTGGTIDKLEAIPGFRTTLTRAEFFQTVNAAGLSVMGQSGNVAPADKKLYALRDVTATVESIPLIAASVMSKKLASGSDCILLDVKTGSGAFMKNRDDACLLARKMVAIGNRAGKKTMALITNMEEPLGNYIGNSLEVAEAIATLKGEGPRDLTDLCIQLAGNMLYLAEQGELEVCIRRAQKTIADGSALNCLKKMIEAQGGDAGVIQDESLLLRAPYSHVVMALEKGYLEHMDAQLCGQASGLLGAGRETKDSEIDYYAGIVLHKKVGDPVIEGEPVATLYASDRNLFSNAEKAIRASIVMSNCPPKMKPLILDRITGE